MFHARLARLAALAAILTIPAAASSQLVELIFDPAEFTVPRIDGISAVALGPDGSIYLAGLISDNAIRIEPDGTVSEIIDSTGDGTASLAEARNIAMDTAGNVFVVSYTNHIVFKIAPGGAISRVITPRCCSPRPWGR